MFWTYTLCVAAIVCTWKKKKYSTAPCPPSSWAPCFGTETELREQWPKKPGCHGADRFTVNGEKRSLMRKAACLTMCRWARSPGAGIIFLFWFFFFGWTHCGTLYVRILMEEYSFSRAGHSNSAHPERRSRLISFHTKVFSAVQCFISLVHPNYSLCHIPICWIWSKPSSK